MADVSEACFICSVRLDDDTADVITHTPNPGQSSYGTISEVSFCAECTKNTSRNTVCTECRAEVEELRLLRRIVSEKKAVFRAKIEESCRKRKLQWSSTAPPFVCVDGFPDIPSRGQTVVEKNIQIPSTSTGWRTQIISDGSRVAGVVSRLQTQTVVESATCSLQSTDQGIDHGKTLSGSKPLPLPPIITSRASTELGLRKSAVPNNLKAHYHRNTDEFDDDLGTEPPIRLKSVDLEGTKIIPHPRPQNSVRECEILLITLDDDSNDIESSRPFTSVSPERTQDSGLSITNINAPRDLNSNPNSLKVPNAHQNNTTELSSNTLHLSNVNNADVMPQAENVGNSLRSVVTKASHSQSTQTTSSTITAPDTESTTLLSSATLPSCSNFVTTARREQRHNSIVDPQNQTGQSYNFGTPIAGVQFAVFCQNCRESTIGDRGRSTASSSSTSAVSSNSTTIPSARQSETRKRCRRKDNTVLDGIDIGTARKKSKGYNIEWSDNEAVKVLSYITDSMKNGWFEKPNSEMYFTDLIRVLNLKNQTTRIVKRKLLYFRRKYEKHRERERTWPTNSNSRATLQDERLKNFKLYPYCLALWGEDSIRNMRSGFHQDRNQLDDDVSD